MSKQDGTDAEGSRGSRTQRGHGGKDAWNPNDGKRADASDFDPAKAARDAERNQNRRGKP